ncbi:hypothetical protein [Helicobacter vulpis]|uniref:hypothetical protein n=1 Tax=Helicobacter vulpis TaxID=2316076 RepID=UPI001F22CEC1|nr:hypothetical protein [Helicobacter vulpis]
MALAMDAEDSLNILGNEAAGDLILKERKAIYSNVGEKKISAMITYTIIPYVGHATCRT